MSVPHIKFYTKMLFTHLHYYMYFYDVEQSDHMNNLKLRWNDLIYGHLFWHKVLSIQVVLIQIYLLEL